MKKVLVVAPHMDDEVLGAGGAICRHVAEGDFVTVCFVCNRAYNHKYTRALIEQERKNARQAQKVLGYQESIFLDLNDEQLDERLITVIVPLEKVIMQCKPAVVYLPHHADNNQDHRAVFQAAMVALRTFAVPFVGEIYSYEVLSSTEQAAPTPAGAFVPTMYVDITAAVEKKKQALACYCREKKAYPHPRSLQAIEVAAMNRGLEAYLEYAEAFSVVRIIGRSKRNR